MITEVTTKTKTYEYDEEGYIIKEITVMQYDVIEPLEQVPEAVPHTLIAWDTPHFDKKANEAFYQPKHLAPTYDLDAARCLHQGVNIVCTDE